MESPVSYLGVKKTDLERLRRAEAILDERDHQDDIWDTQEHTLDEWMTILDKWKGKLAAEIIAGWQEPNENWRRRAIQVAAIALAMVEQYVEPGPYDDKDE